MGLPPLLVPALVLPVATDKSVSVGGCVIDDVGGGGGGSDVDVFVASLTLLPFDDDDDGDDAGGEATNMRLWSPTPCGLVASSLEDDGDDEEDNDTGGNKIKEGSP
jgi:hypothetical protein